MHGSIDYCYNECISACVALEDQRLVIVVISQLYSLACLVSELMWTKWDISVCHVMIYIPIDADGHVLPVIRPSKNAIMVYSSFGPFPF